MARSLKKGPFVDEKLLKKVAEMNDSGKKKAWDKLLKGHDGSITALKIDLTKINIKSLATDLSSLSNESKSLLAIRNIHSQSSIPST